jgi:hypothetical protein
MSAEKIHLVLPYAQKDEGKALGAKWDADAKMWYIMSNNPNKLRILNRWSKYEPKPQDPITFSSDNNQKSKFFR